MQKRRGYRVRRWVDLIVITLFGVVSLTRCANIGMPQGGPIDSLPPIIVSMSPKMGAVNFKDSKIFIEFDEYVATKELQKELYTSPMMSSKPTILSKGRGIEITINDDSLASNTTYSINLGSSVVDNNENNPYHGLRYVFSTGPEVDSMMVSGYTVDGYKRDSIPKTFIHFYDSQLFSGDESADSTLFNKNASVVARAEGNGIFIAQNLKPIPYRVYAFEDKNGSQRYDPGEEMVGFMDSLYNPSLMEGFSIWYDTVRHYFIADPQLYIRLFKDEKGERQKISSLTRPLKNKLVIGFADKEPEIRSLRFKEVDSTQYITEYLSDNRDSIAYWINSKPDELADSIHAEIQYMKPDSTGSHVLTQESIIFIWEEPAESEKDAKKKEELSEDEMTPKQLARKKKRDERRERKEIKRKERAKRLLERRGITILYRGVTDSLGMDSLSTDSLALDSLGMVIAADSLSIDQGAKELKDGEQRPTNPFKFTVTGGKEVNPEQHIAIEFEMPLIRFDSTSMVMIRKEKVKDETKEFKVDTKVEQDSLNIRLWRIKANWIKGANYSLTLPEGSIENVAREKNDTLKSDFSVMNPDKFATLTVSITGKSDEHFYVIEITDEAGSKVIQSSKHAQTGSYKFQYLAPQKIRIRFIEDNNNNGEWDKGSLLRREQPEEVGYYTPESGETINAREGWEIDIEVDMGKLFEPQTMQRTIDEIQRAESKRRAASEKEKKESKKTKKQSQTGGAIVDPRDALGGFGM